MREGPLVFLHFPPPLCVYMCACVRECMSVCVCVYCLVECTNFEIDEDIIGGWGRGGGTEGRRLPFSP